MKRGRSSWVIRAAGIFLAAFAVVVPPGFDRGQAVAQTGDLSEAEALQELESKAVQIIIGKTAAEIREALEAGPFSDVQVMEFDFVPPPEQAAQQGSANIKPGDLHVIFSRPKKSVFEPFSPRISIFVGMQDGVAVSIERVRTYAK